MKYIFSIYKNLISLIYNMSFFFRLFFINKKKLFFETKFYLKNAKKACPMLFFAFSRNYGYAKSRMLTYRGM